MRYSLFLWILIFIELVEFGKSVTLDGSFKDCWFVTPQGWCLLRDMICDTDSDLHQIELYYY